MYGVFIQDLIAIGPDDHAPPVRSRPRDAKSTVKSAKAVIFLIVIVGVGLESGKIKDEGLCNLKQNVAFLIVIKLKALIWKGYDGIFRKKKRDCVSTRPSPSPTLRRTEIYNTLSRQTPEGRARKQRGSGVRRSVPDR